MIGLLGFSGFATCEPLFFARPLDSTTLEDGMGIEQENSFRNNADNAFVQHVVVDGTIGQHQIKQSQ